MNVSLPTCLINLFVISLTISSNPNPMFTLFPRKWSISAFLSLARAHSLQIRTQITRFCNVAYPHLNIRFVFRSCIGIFSFFPFKVKVPKFLKSGVVCLFKCRCCSTSYVGQTTHHLHTRVSEHLGISPVTGGPPFTPVMSSILSHLNCTGHSANFDDVQILSTCSETYELMIHESLLISRLKPSLNVQGSSIPLNLYNSTISCPFFVPLSVLFLLCTTLYPLIPHLSEL